MNNDPSQIPMNYIYVKIINNNRQFKTKKVIEMDQSPFLLLFCYIIQ